jgi:hypothetical protein
MVKSVRPVLLSVAAVVLCAAAATAPAVAATSPSLQIRHLTWRMVDSYMTGNTKGYCSVLAPAGPKKDGLTSYSQCVKALLVPVDAISSAIKTVGGTHLFPKIKKSIDDATVRFSYHHAVISYKQIFVVSNVSHLVPVTSRFELLHGKWLAIPNVQCAPEQYCGPGT